MATVGTNVTMMDFARRLGPDHKITKIIEMLNETNDILDDMVIKECNDGTSHRTTIRTGLPSATWRMLNYGVQPSKSTTQQVEDHTGMLEAYAEVDKMLADLNGNTAAFRLSEDRAFLESMSQSMASTLFYGDTTVHPERFVGLHPRFNAISTTKGDSGYQVLSGGGSGSDNTSMWVVVWGENTIHALYPKGSKAGFQHQDLGEVTLQDAAGGYYQGYRAHYKWDIGLTVRDYRYVGRVCNIDVSELSDAGDSGFDGAALIKLLIKITHRIKNIRGGKAVIYCNETVLTALDLISNYDSRLALKFEEVDGKPKGSFRGITIRRVDEILDTEATIS